jgi:ribosomal protein L7/L12
MKSIQFKLTHTDTQGLVTALEQERKQEPVPRRFLGMSSSSRANHYPVSVPEPGIIRIAWRGSTMEDHVSPAAERAIGLLGAAGVPIHQAALTERADWAQLDGPELDALVRTLARSGNSIEAAKLLCQRRGLTLTEAKRQVEEIATSRQD